MRGASRYSGIRYAVLLGLTVLGLAGCGGGGGGGSYFPGLTGLSSWNGLPDPPDPPSINLSDPGLDNGQTGGLSNDPPNDPSGGDPPLNATPEPPTALLFGTGAAAIAYMYRSMRARRRKDD
jgi:hypothetical protein